MQSSTGNNDYLNFSTTGSGTSGTNATMCIIQSGSGSLLVNANIGSVTDVFGNAAVFREAQENEAVLDFNIKAMMMYGLQQVV